MGGTLSTMFNAIHQDLVKNLVLLATGIDFSTREGLINLWTDPRYFDVDKFVDTMGNIPAEFLQTAFLMLKPIANLVDKPINLMENIHRTNSSKTISMAYFARPGDPEQHPVDASRSG
jgi:polyhydroxyalkanoate synthase subunit PhaC